MVCKLDSLSLLVTSFVIRDLDVEYDSNDSEQIYNLIAVRKLADVLFSSRF